MQRFKNIKHIVFDLDHTLWDFERNSALAYRQIFEEQGVEIPFETFIRVYKPINFKMWKRFRESEISQLELRYQRLNMAFEQCGYQADRPLIDRISEAYLEYLPRYNHLFPDTDATLRRLGANYNLHILTNGFDSIQAKKLSNSGIRDYFNVVLTAETAGFKKPDERIFARLLKEIGATPQESLMVGDSLEADIMGAEATGMPAIWFSSDQNNGRPQISTLPDIYKYLDQ